MLFYLKEKMRYLAKGVRISLKKIARAEEGPRFGNKALPN